MEKEMSPMTTEILKKGYLLFPIILTVYLYPLGWSLTFVMLSN